MTLAAVVPGKGGGMGCYISDPPPCPSNGMWGGLGWATSPLRNLRVGSVAVSLEAWPHFHSGLFKRCGLGWDAELEERLVVVSPSTDPWGYGGLSASPQRLKAMMLPVVFVAAVFSFSPGWGSAQSPA